MSWSRVMLTLSGLVLAAVVGSCGKSEEAAQEPDDEVVADTLDALDEGESWAWKLDPGTYKVEMTASDDGASVKWVGSSCPGSDETAQYSTVCEMKQTGQFIIENSAGSSTTVTLKIIMTSGPS